MNSMQAGCVEGVGGVGGLRGGSMQEDGAVDSMRVSWACCHCTGWMGLVVEPMRVGSFAGGMNSGLWGAGSCLRGGASEGTEFARGVHNGVPCAVALHHAVHCAEHAVHKMPTWPALPRFVQNPGLQSLSQAFASAKEQLARSLLK